MAYTQVTTTNAMLGELIAQLRSAKNVNQSTFAKSIDLSPSAWSRIERGETGLTQDQLKIACDQLNVSRSQLFAMLEEVEKELSNKNVVIKKGNIANLTEASPQTPVESIASTSSTAMTLASIVAGASVGGVIPIVGPTLGALIGVALHKYLKQNT